MIRPSRIGSDLAQGPQRPGPTADQRRRRRQSSCAAPEVKRQTERRPGPGPSRACQRADAAAQESSSARGGDGRRRQGRWDRRAVRTYRKRAAGPTWRGHERLQSALILLRHLLRRGIRTRDRYRRSEPQFRNTNTSGGTHFVYQADARAGKGPRQLLVLRISAVGQRFVLVLVCKRPREEAKQSAGTQISCHVPTPAERSSVRTADSGVQRASRN